LNMRCLFCRTELDSVHWAFDGVSEQPVPACRQCCERLHIKVWRVDVGGGADLPLRVDCVHCGTPLPSADTWPVIAWVKGEMMNNAELLERLFASGGIDLRRGELFDRYPPPLPTTFDWDRVDGMLLGLAIGDALGSTTEGMLPSRRRELYGAAAGAVGRLSGTAAGVRAASRRRARPSPSRRAPSGPTGRRGTRSRPGTRSRKAPRRCSRGRWATRRT